MWNLSWNEVIRGLASACMAGAAMAVLSVLQNVFGAEHLDVFAIDWAGVLRSIVNAAVTGAESGFTGYIGVKFFSDDQKRLFGKIQL